MRSALALVCLVAGPAAAQVAVPALGPGRALAAVPPWLSMAEPGLEATRDKVQAALTLLERSPTGRSLLSELGEGKILIEKDGSLYEADGEATIHAVSDFVDDHPVDVLAVQLSHELEHLRQRRLGVTGDSARSARELAAVLVQVRAWVELGGPVHGDLWKDNRGGSWDQVAALDYPFAALAAIAARAGHQLDLSDPKVKAYWDDVLAADARWRGAWRGRFPTGRDPKEAALLALRQAQRFMDERPAGEVTDALPAAIEAAARGGPVPPGLSPVERDILGRVLPKR